MKIHCSYTVKLQIIIRKNGTGMDTEVMYCILLPSGRNKCIYIFPILVIINVIEFINTRQQNKNARFEVKHFLQISFHLLLLKLDLQN